ncbi:MAG: response regulator [Flavobacteriales bacterium]|nr:response regulator [Flavobacteriales bacterium]
MEVVEAQKEKVVGKKKFSAEYKKDETRLIFLVDDQEIFLRILESDLRNVKDCMIMTFTSGEECLKNMYLEPELVVLDYDLSGQEGNLLSGIEVLKRIKTNNPATEVVMLSSHEEIQVAVASMKFGAYDYVVKDEFYVNNVRNKARNIFMNFSMLRSLRTEKMMRWAISLGLVFAAGITYLVQQT